MITQEMAEVAAQWWVDCFSNPSQKLGVKDELGGISERMLTVLAATKRPGVDDLHNLKETMLGYLVKHQPRYLDVDYHPDHNLSEIARLANFKGMFPVKTVMVFKDNTVSVKRGYGSDYEQIYPVISHQKPNG